MRASTRLPVVRPAASRLRPCVVLESPQPSRIAGGPACGFQNGVATRCTHQFTIAEPQPSRPRRPPRRPGGGRAGPLLDTSEPPLSRGDASTIRKLKVARHREQPLTGHEASITLGVSRRLLAARWWPIVRSRRRSGDSSAAVLVVLGLLAGLGWLSEQPRWLQVLASASAAVAVGAWLALFRIAADCNVPYVTVAGRCNVRVPGLLGACDRPGHKVWKRQALWWQLLGRPAPPPPGRTARPARSASRPPLSRPSPPDPDSERWLLQDAPHKAATLAIGVVGTLAGVASVGINAAMLALMISAP